MRHGFARLEAINRSGDDETLIMSARSLSALGLIEKTAASLKRHKKDLNIHGPNLELLAPQHRLMVVRSSNVKLPSTRYLKDEKENNAAKGGGGRSTIYSGTASNHGSFAPHRSQYTEQVENEMYDSPRVKN